MDDLTVCRLNGEAMNSEEFAIFFENGAWVALRQDSWGNVMVREVCPSLETAIQAVAAITGAPVGLKLITKQP